MSMKKIGYSINVETRKALRELDRMAKAAGDSEDALDDIETAGKRAARAIEMSADAMIDEIDDTRRAVDRLDQALGPDFDADTRDVVADLKRLGLTAQDIEADADELAAALRRAGDVKTHAAAAGFDDVAQAVDGVRDDTGRAHDSMTGFIGGTVGELPGISDAMGPVAEGLGQLTEGAIEGEISLKQLAIAGGAMAGVALLVGQVAQTLDRAAKVDAWKAEEVDAYVDALQEADSLVEGITDKLREAGRIEFNLFGDEVDVTEEFVALGATVADVARIIERGERGIEDWAAEMRAAGVDSERVSVLAGVLRQQLEALEDAQAGADVTARFLAVSQGEVADALDDLIAKADPIGQFPDEFGRMAAAIADGVTPAVADVQTVMNGLNVTVDEAVSLAADHADSLAEEATALAEAGDAAGDTADEVDELTEAFAALRDEMSDRSGYLDLKDGFDDAEQAIADAFAAAETGADDAERKIRDAERAQIRLTDEVLDYASSIDNISPEKVSDIIAMIDRGALAEAEAELDNLERARTTTLRVRVLQDGSIRLPNGMRALARGGLTGPFGALAGENHRPELVDGHLVTGPTAVGPGRRVTGEAATARLLRDMNRRPASTTNIYVGPGYTPADIDELAERHRRRVGR